MSIEIYRYLPHLINFDFVEKWGLLVGTFSGECLGSLMCVHVSGLWESVNFIVWVYCIYTMTINKQTNKQNSLRIKP